MHLIICLELFFFTEDLVQMGGGVHHERPEAHQQGIQVEHLHGTAVPSLSQVSISFLKTFI
jgi:hypothetical protein